ncbi:right-handed parallel beta-helix repeat-containing protein [Halegenticoccus soli]|uniref:right-handed parallel beta-helix repeat-containing protein n=1 Tax=Halegenticoccus soli TaxID=1985678 RepID=UPI000C6E8FCC|nr:right-handed parallel beta-helix repeat-containing protein [Halegenticoccus soli]
MVPAKVPSGKRKRVALGLLFVLALLSIGSVVTSHDYPSGSDDSDPGNATPITQCTTITEPGRYVLAEDLGDGTGLSASCITISSSHVTLDGADRTVGGGGVSDSTGILVSHPRSVTNVTVHSLTVTDWNRGIHVRNASDVSVRGVNASHNAEGIAFWNASRSSVTDSIAEQNLFGVVVDDRSEGIEIERSRIEGNYAGDVERWERSPRGTDDPRLRAPVEGGGRR